MAVTSGYRYASPTWRVRRACRGCSQRGMLVLFDTPAGHALFKLKKPDKLKDPDSLDKSFSDIDGAHKL